MRSMNVTLVFVLLGLFPAMAMGDSGLSAFAKNMDEQRRMTSCVYGGLPMDIQFDTPNVPPRINTHSSFGDTESDLLAHALDGRIGFALSAAFDHAMKEQRPGAIDFAKLSLEFRASLQENAAKELNLEFCGEQQEVGQTVVAAVASWFGRALASNTDSNSLEEWFNRIDVDAKNHETEFAMLATANALSSSNVNMAILTQAFRESLQSK